MTLPFSRRSRERRAAIAGDFPETGETITEILERVRLSDTEILSHVHHDDTIAFDGASAGTMPQAEVYGDAARADREAGLRQAVEMTDPDTQPVPKLRAQPRDIPAPAYASQDPRDTGPMQRLPRFSRTAARPRPQRPADAAIFIWSGLLGQHIMKCGVCLRSRYADPVTAHMPFTFEALRVSAHTAGWRLDTFARWACPACLLTPAYHAPYPVICYDAQAAAAVDSHDEFWHRSAAEHDLIRNVAAAAKHGRRRAGAR